MSFDYSPRTLSLVAVVPPSGDQSGTADTERLNAALSAGPGIVGLLGHGAQYYVTTIEKPVGTSLVGAGNNASFVNVLGSGHGIEVPAPGAGLEPHDLIEGFSLVGKAGTQDGIHFDDAAAAVDCLARIAGVRIESFGGDGIYVGSFLGGVQVGDQTQVNGCGGDGIHILGTDADVDRAVVDSNSGSGIYAGGTLATIRGCSIGGNKTGVLVQAPGVSIIGNGIDRNTQQAVYVGGAGCSIVGNQIHSNSQGVDAGYFDIDVAEAGGSVLGNYFFYDGSGNRPAANVGVEAGKFVSTKANWSGAGYAHNGLSNFSVPAVPATGVASSAFGFDTMLYVAAGASTCEVAVTPPATQGAAAAVFTIPASAVASVRVPAGSTVTYTYTAAPSVVGMLEN